MTYHRRLAGWLALPPGTTQPSGRDCSPAAMAPSGSLAIFVELRPASSPAPDQADGPGEVETPVGLRLHLVFHAARSSRIRGGSLNRRHGGPTLPSHPTQFPVARLAAKTAVSQESLPWPGNALKRHACETLPAANHELGFSRVSLAIPALKRNWIVDLTPMAGVRRPKTIAPRGLSTKSDANSEIRKWKSALKRSCQLSRFIEQ